MVQTQDGVTDASAVGEAASWRDRALERSLRGARAKAISRSDRFIQTAMELLEETGRADFTVQEIVERSRTSLRSFYQYFAGKDELLLAILEETIVHGVARMRQEIEGKGALESLRVVISGLYGGSGGNRSLQLSRALTSHHMALVDTNITDYVQAEAPVEQLIRELVQRGVDEGELRSDIPVDALVIVLFQTVMGAATMNVLNTQGGDLARHAETLWEFCRVGLVGAASPAAPIVARPPAQTRGRRN